MAIFLSVTRLRVRSFVYLPQFLWYALRSARQAEHARGFLSGKLFTNAKSVYWTVTSWDSEAAMNEFRITAVHRAAMPKLMNICNEASVVHWSQNSPDLPTWTESHRRMVAEGRTSKVNRPSPGHLAAQIPHPRPSRLERILKPNPRNR